MIDITRIVWLILAKSGGEWRCSDIAHFLLMLGVLDPEDSSKRNRNRVRCVLEKLVDRKLVVKNGTLYRWSEHWDHAFQIDDIMDFMNRRTER